jgi:peptide/nickel transport system substrate-binding protein
VAANDPGTKIDPAIASDIVSASFLTMTGDGLTAFKRSGGSDGSQLVPDLAVSLPTPTNGGKTYTFNRAARTVTFRLTAPDPEFLTKLGLSFAYVLPASTPRRPTGTKPPPATGPYLISAYRPGHLVTLVRNPRFREWSQAAQPDGYPDRIEVRLDLSPDEAVNAVLRGRADEYDGVPASRMQEVTTRYAGQVHSHAQPTTYYLFLNTRVPPFDDPRARRAVALAVDRATLVAVRGGPRAAQATCQILPPNFPGYRPYRPFARPDPARARQLVAASGTKGWG